MYSIYTLACSMSTAGEKNASVRLKDWIDADPIRQGRVDRRGSGQRPGQLERWLAQTALAGRAVVALCSCSEPSRTKKIFALGPWRSFLSGIGSARSAPTKNNDDIPTTDTTEIKRLINPVKRGELGQDEAQLIEKLES